MRKTLGGDRLGSGKKMKVDLHGYERSTHDLSYLWRSTMSAGTLVPFMVQLALPGDTFDIDLNCDIKTHPTVGPLFGSYKAQLDTFLCPIRLYNSLLHNNALGIGLNMKQVKFPTLRLSSPVINPDADPTDWDNCQINPSCILSYLGIRGVGVNTAVDSSKNRTFNAIPFLAYWEIYKNYYSNKQEEIGAYIHTPAVAIIETVDAISIQTPPAPGGTLLPENTSTGPISLASGTKVDIDYITTPPLPSQIVIATLEHGDIPVSELCTLFTDDGSTIHCVFRQTMYGDSTALYWRYVDASDVNNGKPAVATFPLANLDEMRTAILAYHSTVAPFSIIDEKPTLTPYSSVFQAVSTGVNAWDILYARLSSQEGLGLKTYQSDLLNNWIQTEWIDGTTGVNQISAVDVSGGYLQMDALNLAKKVYNYLNRVAISGGTYDDWLDVTWDHERYTKAESPMYMGGLIKELVFQEVVSNSQSSEQPLGTLAGKGVMSNKHKGGKVVIKVDEPSYIIGIVSLTPRIDYSQGNRWDTHLQTMDDLHKPALDEIGFQELITEQMAWWDTAWDTGSSKWVQKSAGKQPAWVNYMTNYNQVYGNFAINSNEMFMTLNRRYEKDDTGIKDLTTYIDPSKFNFIFAETALDAQNFWTQIAVNITARRKMSAKVMPNL